jgi:hypothetical protein
MIGVGVHRLPVGGDSEHLSYRIVRIQVTLKLQADRFALVLVPGCGGLCHRVGVGTVQRVYVEDGVRATGSDESHGLFLYSFSLFFLF